jgi:hypothetical protein
MPEKVQRTTDTVKVDDLKALQGASLVISASAPKQPKVGACATRRVV